MSIPPTNNSKVLFNYAWVLFQKHYNQSAVRNISVNFSKLTSDDYMQLDLFENPDEQINDNKLDYLVDEIRNKYGFEAIVHASSKMAGGTAISRSNIVGGHAGGNDGL